jgi:hypothetical protein
MVNEKVFEIIVRIDTAISEYQDQHGGRTADVGLDTLGALGYFAGSIIAQAPDHDLRMQAHKFFLEMLNDGLRQNEVVKH